MTLKDLFEHDIPPIVEKLRYLKELACKDGLFGVGNYCEEAVELLEEAVKRWPNAA